MLFSDKETDMTFLEIEWKSNIQNRPRLAWLQQLWDRVIQQRRLRRQRRIDRQAFENLLYLDKRVLADLGYRSDDVQAAYRLPLSTNAAQHLRLKRSVERATANTGTNTNG
jgi:hypothetical protein